jgi:hypothetical protein
MTELTRRIKDHQQYLFFCHVPNTAGRSLLSLFKSEGWSSIDEVEPYLNHFEIRLRFKEQKRKVPTTLAVVRHPFRRVESAFAKKGRSKSPNDMFAQLEDMTVSDFYKKWSRQLRPASDLVLENTKIFHFEDGLTKISKKLASMSFVSHNAKVPQIGLSNRQPLDWTKAPQHIVEKLMQIYAQDLYYFNYPLFPED